MRKRTKTILILSIIVLLLVVAICIVVGISNKNQSEVMKIEIAQLDLSTIEDGVYTGSYNAFPVIVKVEVTIADHTITDIQLLQHINGQGSAAEAILDTVLIAQSLQVDTVSGATYSSTVILLAIQDALGGEAK